ncbi:MAG: hypothetical protein EA349_03745 [Halomonadaceae bacterium]|nr:MAG: hypothetical protein EA349_03745 [Halomonadaceae bacterium]
MFLNRLSFEQKVMFLRIGHHIANVDGNFEASEDEMLKHYALEMNLKHELENLLKAVDDESETIDNMSFEGLVDKISKPSVARIIAGGVVPGLLVSTIWAAHGKNEDDKAGNSETHLRNIKDPDFVLEEALECFDTRTAQRILVLELMAVVYANDSYHPQQREVIEFILDVFDLSEHLVTVYAEWAKTMLSMQKQGTALIHL